MYIDHGDPHRLRNDNTRMETGNAWNDITRKYDIAVEQTTPSFRNQNFSIKPDWSGKVTH